MTPEQKLKVYMGYDAETGKLAWVKSPNASVPVGKEVQSTTDRGYYLFRLDKIRYSAHRVAWLLHYGCWPEGEIDHVNGITGDNRIVNLRDVTHQQNMFNQAPRKGGTSKYKGVYWHKANRKWRAVSQYLGKKVHIGMFNCETAAAMAYDNYVKATFKGFARCNF